MSDFAVYIMYSSVPPPEQVNSGIESDTDKEKEGPPRGISEETWQVFTETALPPGSLCTKLLNKAYLIYQKQRTKYSV